LIEVAAEQATHMIDNFAQSGVRRTCGVNDSQSRQHVSKGAVRAKTSRVAGPTQSPPCAGGVRSQRRQYDTYKHRFVTGHVLRWSSGRSSAHPLQFFVDLPSRTWTRPGGGGEQSSSQAGSRLQTHNLGHKLCSTSDDLPPATAAYG